MAIISTFKGITVKMEKPTNGSIKKPYFIAEYPGHKCIVGLDSDTISGNFSKPFRYLVEGWAVVREKELKKNWERLKQGIPLKKIEAVPQGVVTVKEDPEDKYATHRHNY